MPFTFSHPALVLPFCWLKRSYFSTSALVVGSIAPDFEYFISMQKGTSQHSHTLGGLFYFNLPLALTLLFLFHEVIKAPLLQHLPSFLYKRFYKPAHFQWRAYFSLHWGIVVSSILLGAALHLSWDWVVHTSADYLYARQHYLHIFSSWQHHTVIYRMVHVAHSLAGLAAVAFAIYKLPSALQAKPHASPYRYWLLVLFLLAFISTIRFFFSAPIQVEDIVITLMAALLLSITVVSFFYRSRYKMQLMRVN